MRHNIFRGLKKWKQEAYFQFLPVLPGGGSDLMQVSPQIAAGAVLDFITPRDKRIRDGEGRPILGPDDSASFRVGGTIADVSDVIDDPAAGMVEERIFYLNGDLDMIVSVRNYNPGVALGDMENKEFLQLLAGALEPADVEGLGVETRTQQDVF